MNFPKSKTTEIIVQSAGNELLIYNLKNLKAFCLNETLTRIYQACDGKTEIEKIKRKYKYSDDLIYLGLDELRKNELIEETYQTKFAGLSRRKVIKNIGLASITALPIITSLVAPSAIQAGSNCAAPSSAQSFDASGTCTSNCFDCQCARDYCNANAVPCCSGSFTTSNFNGIRIFCNC